MLLKFQIVFEMLEILDILFGRTVDAGPEPMYEEKMRVPPPPGDKPYHNFTGAGQYPSICHHILSNIGIGWTFKTNMVKLMQFGNHACTTIH